MSKLLDDVVEVRVQKNEDQQEEIELARCADFL